METARDLFTSLVTRRSYFTCEVCGNEYDKVFEVSMDGKTHMFDCLECAIQALAPECAHCGCRIIGHGMEAAGDFYCSAHCAREGGIYDLEDRPIPERERGVWHEYQDNQGPRKIRELSFAQEDPGVHDA